MAKKFKTLDELYVYAMVYDVGLEHYKHPYQATQKAYWVDATYSLSDIKKAVLTAYKNKIKTVYLY